MKLKNILLVVGVWLLLIFANAQADSGKLNRLATQTLTLTQPGWHLLHLGTISDLDTLLANHPKIKSIWGWDDSQSDWLVKFQTTPADNTFGALTALEANRGYWFRTSEPVTIEYDSTNSISTFSDYNLSGKTGWHLLGTPSILDVVSFFGSDFPAQGTVWTWGDNYWAIFTKGDIGNTNQFNSQQGTSFANLRSVEPGQGFWVNLQTGDTTLSEPSNIQITPGDQQVVIQWDAVSGASNYTLYYGAKPSIDLHDSSSYTAKMTTTDTSQVLTGLTESNTYYFVLVSNSATSYQEVYSLTLTSNTGKLTYRSRVLEGDSVNGGGTVAGLERIRNASISPDGKHLYVTGRVLSGGSTVSYNLVTFEIDSTSGSLAYVESLQNGNNGISNMQIPWGVVISPDGQHAYVTAYFSSSIVIFDRDSSTGKLTYRESITQSEVSGLFAAQEMVMSHDGKFINVVGYDFSGSNENFSNLVVFSRNTTTGALTHTQTVSNGSGDISGLKATSVVLSPDDKFLYTSGANEGNLLVFSRNTTTGELTYVTQYFSNDSNLSHLADIKKIAISPDGANLYSVSGTANDEVISNAPGNAIMVFSRNSSDGSLTLVEEHTATTLANLERGTSIAVSPDGMSVYSTAYVGVFVNDDSINVFRRDLNDGKLTYQESIQDDFLSNSTYNLPSGLVVNTSGDVIYSLGKVYVSNGSVGAISVFQRNPSSQSTASALTTPTQVNGLSTSVVDSGVNLNWQKNDAAFNYTVYQGLATGVDPSDSSTYNAKYESITDNFYTVSSLTNDTQYYFVVTAKNHKGESIASAEVGATPTGNSIVSVCDTSVSYIKPAIADRFHLDLSTPANSSQFSLSWIPLKDATTYTYDISFGNGGGAFDPFDLDYFKNIFYYKDVAGIRYVPNGDSLDWKSGDITTSTLWQFKITAKDSSQNSFLSTEGYTVTAGVGTNTLAKPSHLWGSSGNQSITLHWCDVENDGGYRIHYGTSMQAIESNSMDVAQNSTTATLTGLSNGTNYYVTVTAINNDKIGIPAYPVVFTPTDSTSIDFSIGNVTLNQAIQANLTDGADNSVPIIEGKPTILRVFTTITGKTQRSKVLVKLSGSRTGTTLDPIFKEVPLSHVTLSEDEEYLPITFDLPSHWLVTGTEFSIELDTDNQFDETDETNNRFPTSGTRLFSFEAPPTFKVRFVPMQNSQIPALTITDALKQSFENYLSAIYPVHTLVFEYQTNILEFDDTATVRLTALNKLEEYRALDIASNEKDIFYYGIINANVGGLANINETVTDNPALEGVGSTDLVTVAHEIGHNHGRNHVENKDETNDSSCQLPDNTDSAYPYNTTGAEYGRIGKVGYNFVTKELYSKSLYHDMMSYCSRAWISDYTYKALYDFQTALAAKFPSNSQQRSLPQEGTLVFGTVSKNKWSIDSTYVVERLVSSQGKYRMEVTDAKGKTHSIYFDLIKRDHDKTQRFQVFIPTGEAFKELSIWETKTATRLLKETVVETRSTLRSESPQVVKIDETHWEVQPTVQSQRVLRLSKDGGQTWRVASMGNAQTAFILKAEVGDQLEIQLSQGLLVHREIHILE